MKRSEWWWTDLTRTGRAVRAVLLGNRNWERIAWLYEIERREGAGGPNRKPFDKLSRQEQRDLMPEARGITWSSGPARVGFSEPCPFRWNLGLREDILASAFLDWIASQRRKAGVTKPELPRGGSRRPVPWNVVESMDRHASGEKLGEKSSQVSKAKKAYRASISKRV